MAAEAKNPQRTLPAAVFGTISIVTVFYALAALALVGMQPYEDIDAESGFSLGFKAAGWQWASQLVAAGELVTLPIVVLISFMAQPRLQYAMAVDGLLPPVFSRLDRHGNLRDSMVVTGVALTLVALLVPFTYLNDMISAGVLLSFNLTNSSLVVIRRQDPAAPRRCVTLLAWFNGLAFLSAMLFAYLDLESVWVLLPALSLAALGYLAWELACLPETADPEAEVQFRVPWAPLTPLLGIYLNSYLVAQLTPSGLLLILGYVAVGVLFYFSYGIRHSVGNADFWADVLRESSSMTMDAGARSSLERMLFGRASNQSVVSGEQTSVVSHRSVSPALKSRGSGSAGSGSGSLYSAVSNPLMSAVEFQEEEDC
jgi:basic amino acid/polyamine antiporter, APA family